jgi:hypothetical protein
MASMASDDPPDSLAFDAMWGDEPVDAETSAAETARPGATTAPVPDEPVREEDRATIAPPLPPKEYVRRMMQIGELDDPVIQEAEPPLTARLPTGLEAVWARVPTPPHGLPAMATEREMMQQHAALDAPSPFGEATEFSERFVPGELSRPRRRASSSSGDLGRRGPAPLPIAPVPRLAPIHDIADFDTLSGIGPLSPDPFEESWSPAAGNLAANRLLARQHEPSGDERKLTPTGMRVRPIPGAPDDSMDGPSVDLSLDSLPPSSESEPELEPSSFDQRVIDMRALLAANNYSSALVLAESVLVADPTHSAGRHCVETCREALSEKYLGSLGGRRAVPKVSMTPEEVRWLSLDHRSGFLLSFVDGCTCVDEVLDVSSMPELDALRILFELRMQGVIEMVEPRVRR